MVRYRWGDQVSHVGEMNMRKGAGKSTGRPGLWLDLLRCEYAEMCELQEILRGKRERGEIPDLVIMLEHVPCITIGSGGGYDNLLVDRTELEKRGIPVHDTPRGGNITYHGPGQLVCYPIIYLEDDQRDLHAYARKMEEVMIRTLHSFGVAAGRKAKFPRVWVGDSKIGAMGIAVRKWVTMHGIALNVCPNLDYFSFIIPCGITTNGVTSMTRVLGRRVDISAVRDEMRNQFADIFRMSLCSSTVEQLMAEDCGDAT
ncbi:MAG: lipoyl(octanoyl) transferase LipB [Desulfopila sp.]